MIEAEQIMKRCQAGTRNYNEANNLHAACYGIIGKLLSHRTWVGLTDEEVRQMCGSVPSMKEAVREAEAKLKEKNCAG